MNLNTHKQINKNIHLNLLKHTQIGVKLIT